MEELKILVDMVAHLPQMALWVLLGFLAYKLAIVGSIYGVIRFVTAQVIDWLREKKAQPIETKEVRYMLDGLCITGQLDMLISQLTRIGGKGTNIQSTYIHNCSINWLREAINDKEEKDRRAEEAKAKTCAVVANNQSSS